MDNKKSLDTRNLVQFYKIRNDLIVKDRILYFNDRICIPKALRLYILEQLHKTHMGIEKTKNRARNILYWPGMYVDISNFISSCRTCEVFARNNVKD